MFKKIQKVNKLVTIQKNKKITANCLKNIM